MAVPDNYTFTLTDVKNNVTGSPNDLAEAFSMATPIAFDATYSGAKNSLRNFRNYNEGGGGGNELTISESYLVLGGGVGITTIDVFSNTSWEATCPADWLTLNDETGTGDGAFGFLRSQNNTGILRSTTITVQTTAGTPSITRFLIVDQEPFD